MKVPLLYAVLCGGVWCSACLPAGQAPPTALQVAALENVNSRYIVESVEIAGQFTRALSRELRDHLHHLVGSRFNAAEMSDLSARLRSELHLRSVTPHVLRGSVPDQVRLVFEIERRAAEFDVSVPKFLYHSTQGWSGELDASTTVARNRFQFGLVSDGDELTERFAGINAAYENQRLGSSRAKFRFLFESFHEQWNRSTRNALGPGQPGLYRERRNYQPELAFALTGAWTLTAGASFEQLQMQQPLRGGDAANALTTAIAYHRAIENAGVPQTLDAAYGLRVGARALGSDFGYTRHRLHARYQVSRNRQTWDDEVTAGYIAGRAPLFERFVLGTSSLLRGWNRYEIDPLGGARLVHNSLEYGYRTSAGTAQVFYDAGALWNGGDTAHVRHSVGCSFRKGVFLLAMAVPLREGRFDPVFMVGMNY